MVMDQFVTTYRKDYLWPYVRTLGVRPYNEPKGQLLPCECRGDSKRYSDPMGQMLGPHAYEGESWSRLGPMGPLLDPKIYPAKMSAAPESQLSRYDQPNVFLAKLQEKYPFIYECLRTAPPDDILARINRDRLRTTYQVDYCKMNEYPSAPYDELLRAAGVDGLPPCRDFVNSPQGDSFPIYSRSRLTGSHNKSGQPCGSIYKSKEAAYCEEIPTGTPMEMILTATNDVAPSCPVKKPLCRNPYCKPKNKAVRDSSFTNHFFETDLAARRQEICHKKPTKASWSFKDPPKPNTTYQDTIGKSGNLVLMSKF